MSLLRTQLRGTRVACGTTSSRETLHSGQGPHPNQYQDLVGAGGGLLGLLHRLIPDAQDDIIARTEHCL